MADLIDMETGEVVENVHDWRVADYLASGRYRPLETSQYRVVAFNEETNRWDSQATVSGRDLVRLVGSGQVFLPSADSEDTARASNFEGDVAAEMGGARGMAATALTGLGSGATAGLTDVAVQRLSPEVFNRLQMARQTNPITDVLSTGVGGVASIAAAGAPATVQAAVAGLGMRPFASRIAAEALLGTAEGALTETALQMRNPQFSASAVAQSAGLGALWGGGLAGIFQTGAAGLSGARRLAERFRTSRAQTAGGVVTGTMDDAVETARQRLADWTPADRGVSLESRAADLYRARAAEGSIADRLRARLLSFQSRVGGTPEETLMALRTPEYADLAVGTADTRRLRVELFDELNNQMLPRWQQAMETAEGANRAADRGILSSRGFTQGVAELEQDVIGRMAREGTLGDVDPRSVLPRNLLDQGRLAGREVINALQKRLSQTTGAAPALHRLSSELERQYSRLEQLSSRAAAGEVVPFAEAYAAVDDIAATMRRTAIDITTENPFYQGLLKDSALFRSRVLGDPAVVGPSLANFRNKLDLVETAVQEPLAEISRILGDVDQYGRREIDSAKLHALVGSFAEPETGATNYTRLMQAFAKLDSSFEVSQLVRNAEPVPPHLQAILDMPVREVPEATTPLMQRVTHLASRLRAEATARSVMGAENQSSAVANLTSAGAGAAVHSVSGQGPQGIVAGLMTGLGVTNLFRPGQAAIRAARWRIGHAANVAQEVAERKTSALSRLSSRLRGATGSTAVATARRASMWANWLRDPKERQEVYQDSADMIREIAVNPDMRQDILTARMAGLYENDPDFALALADTMNRSLDYLFINLPKGDMQLMPGVRIPPSQTEIDSFMRRVQAIEDPYSLIDDFADGIMSPEAVDAVRNVHPEMYADIVASIGDAVQAATESRAAPIPYTYRVQMALMFGNHMDPTMKPSFVNAMQSHAAQTAQQASVIGSNFNGGQLDTAKNTRTNVDDIEEIP